MLYCFLGFFLSFFFNRILTLTISSRFPFHCGLLLPEVSFHFLKHRPFVFTCVGSLCTCNITKRKLGHPLLTLPVNYWLFLCMGKVDRDIDTISGIQGSIDTFRQIEKWSKNELVGYHKLKISSSPLKSFHLLGWLYTWKICYSCQSASLLLFIKMFSCNLIL